MYAMALFLFYVLRGYVTEQNFIILFLIHTFVFLYRAYKLLEYRKQRSFLDESKDIKKWVHNFQRGSLFAGFAWGSFLFFLSDVPLAYNLLIMTMIVGMAAIAMSTLGAIFSIYLSFITPMLFLTLFWILMHIQTDEIYSVIILPFIVMIIYLFISARRFGMNFRKSFIEESRANFLKERMELALDGSNTAILDWDMKKNNLFISESWKMLLGFANEELPNRVTVWRERVHPEDRKKLFTSLKRDFKNRKEIFESTHRLQRKDGSYIWVFGRARIFYDEQGRPSRIIGTHTDITRRKLAEADVAEKKVLLEESQRLAHIGSWRFDMRSRELNWSDEIYRILEVESDVIPSYEIFLKRIHPEDRDRVKNVYRDSLKTGETYEITHRLLFDDGRVKYVKEECETHFDGGGTALASIGSVQDVTKQKLLENMLHEQKEVLSHLAHHDTLTELPNRTLLYDRLSQAIPKAKREEAKFAVLFLDLDHFKEINDSLGHDIGDEVLKEVARRFKSMMREGDTLARLGGDEFTVLMENLTQGQDASILAQKLLDSLSQTIVIDDNFLYLSCSIGISLYPADGTSVQDLLKYADAAMYKAKEEGRSNFQFYSSEMTALAFERVVMEASLRSGLENGEFEVYYQPQVNGATETLVGMEALVRWNHPNMGLVFPSKFIPLAESTGLLIKLDRTVMRSAMQQVAQWYKEGLNPGVLALNLSIGQLKQKDFIPFLEALLQETQCKTGWLELEVTESQIMTNTQEAIAVLTQLNKLGVMIAIDDFGTGYSSLSYLKKLPIDKLKIDQSFVRELPENEEDAAIADAVIALAKSLKLNIIAEGVETKEQKEFCVSHGCVNIQGYYYSKAIPKEAIEKILQNGL